MKTFRDVLTALQALSSEQLDGSLTWRDRDDGEFYLMENFTIAVNTKSDRLDAGHPFFEVDL